MNAGRLHGLTENSILAVYPPTGPTDAGKLLGHVVLTGVRATNSDVTIWDEAKAAPFQKAQYKAPTREFEGGERCEAVFLAYGDMKLQLMVAPDDGRGQPVAPEAQQRVRQILGQLSAEAKQFVSVVDEVTKAQWLARPADGGRLELVRREGMEAGPLIVPEKPQDLSLRLINIARAQMLMQLGTDYSPPDATAIQSGEAIAFDVDLLRRAGDQGEFRPIPLASGGGTVFLVGDQLQLRFTNMGKIDTDITVLQVDQNYNIIPVFPRPSGGVLNRLFVQEKIQRADKSLYTTRPRVKEDGVTPFKDANGDQKGLHSFVILAVAAEGDPVDFLGLAAGQNAPPARGDHRGLRRAGPVLNALQGRGDVRAGLDEGTAKDYVVRVIRWEIRKPAARP